MLALAVVLTLVAIPVTVFLAKQQQDARAKAAPATTLSFSPATITKKANETFPLEVRIDTAENQVVAAELHITYDPEKLEAQTITNGALFPNVLTSGKVERGSASITVGAASATTPVKGTGSVAVVTFKALSQTTSPISVRFAATTFVGALGESAANVLISSTPATVTITGEGGAVATPTPTGAAQTTITPTPTKAPTLNGTLTPTPTKSATQSAQATSSAVLITSPVDDTSVASAQPTIQGKAPPGSTITLTIYSNPITVTVTADANGNWSYTPTAPLEAGPHNIVASALDPASGQTQTATTSFVVASGGSGSSTDSATPIAGTLETTMILLAIGILLMGAGALIPAFIR